MRPMAIILTGLLTAAAASEARAQGAFGQPGAGPPGGGMQFTARGGQGAGGMEFQARNGPGDLSALIRERAVQTELKVTEKQKKKLDEVFTRLDQMRTEVFQRVMGAGLEGGGPKAPGNREQMAAAQADYARQSEEVMAQVLERKQITRLKEIALQQEGLVAVARQEIADKINLSYPQREAIRAIIDEWRQAQTELSRSVTGGSGMMVLSGRSQGKGKPPQIDRETLAKVKQLQDGREQLRKTSLQRINRLLTKKQGAAFTKLLGEPFDFGKLTPFGQGRLVVRGKPAADRSSPSADEPAAPAASDAKSSPNPTRKARAKSSGGGVR